jgi:hypothetical protein
MKRKNEISPTEQGKLTKKLANQIFDRLTNTLETQPQQETTTEPIQIPKPLTPGKDKSCGYCFHSFSTASECKTHTKTSHPDTSKCPHCNNLIKSRGAIKHHVLKHPDTAVFQCGYCLTSLYTKYDIEKHLNDQHPDNDPCHNQIFYILNPDRSISYIYADDRT